MNTKLRNIALTGLLGLVGATTLSGCGGCRNWANDISRNLSLKNYEITLYSANGDVIFQDSPTNTFINIGENGSGIRYLKNGKLVMLNGTYVAKEK